MLTFGLSWLSRDAFQGVGAMKPVFRPTGARNVSLRFSICHSQSGIDIQTEVSCHENPF